jgi:hypothetical protein
MSWRLAKGLAKLRDQVNAKYPNRSRASDGTIGDKAHSRRASDHNPSGGVVHAIDITHDPAHGFDAHAMAERVRLSRDSRLNYIISNRRIASAAHGWTWRPYKGNPHSKHVHYSIKHGAAFADNTKTWSI